MPGEPCPGDGQRDADALRPGDPGGPQAGEGPGPFRGGDGPPAEEGPGPFRDGPAPLLDDGPPAWALPDDRPPGGGDWWPAEDFEEPWPDYGSITAVDAGPAAGLDPGLDAGFLPRDPVAGQQGRAGSGFTSGHAFDTSAPGPALAQALDAATSPADGYQNLDDDELIGVLAGWQRTEGWAAAGRLAAVAELAARRPAATRRDAATRGGTRAGWNKFCADEVAVALAVSRRAAERMVPLAHDLATRLPLTRQALAGGILGDYKAQVIAEATRVLDDAAAAEAEAAVVPHAVTGKTPGQIRAAIGRAVLKAGPDAARRRREEAEKDPRVELWREDAGTAAICGYGLPPDAALAADEAITTAALDLKAAGMAGTMDQLRARAYLDALLGQDSRPTAPRQNPPARPPPARSPPVRKPPARSPPVRNPSARSPPVRKPPARSPPARKPLAPRLPVQKPPARSPPARKPPARRLRRRSPPAGKPPARRVPTRGPVLARLARTAETAAREPPMGRAETARPAEQDRPADRAAAGGGDQLDHPADHPARPHRPPGGGRRVRPPRRQRRPRIGRPRRRKPRHQLVPHRHR